MNITVFLPETPEDVLSRSDEIMMHIMNNEVEGYTPAPDIIEWLSEHPHSLYLFYADEKPMAMIRLDDRAMNPRLGRNTVQIHGGILPEYRGLIDIPVLFVFRAAFKVKKNIIAKFDPGNMGALGFCRKWGFKRINREHGKLVYRLKRSEFMRFENAQRG